MRTLIVIALLLLAPTTLAAPEPRTEVVRSRLGPFELVDLIHRDGKTRVVTPMSPSGFGQTSGVSRFLAASEQVGAIVIEVVGDNEGGLFAVPTDGGAPVRLGASRGVDFSVALSPDGRWLAVSDERRLRIVYVTLDPADARELELVDPRPVKEQRFEQLRWRDGHVLFARSYVTARKNQLLTHARVESVSMLGQWHVVVPDAPKRTQDWPVDALADGRVLFYRDGVLMQYDPQAKELHTFGDDVSVPPRGAVEGGVLLARGESGVERTVAYELLGAAGTRAVTPTQMVYLDPLVAPDQRSFWLTVKRGGGWVVERVEVATGARRAIGSAHATPTELVATTRDGRAVGCRGDDIVVVGQAMNVVARSDGLPSCTLRQVVETARGPLVVYDAKVADGFRTTLVPLDGGRQVAVQGEVSWAGAIGEHVVLRSYAEAAATIVVDGKTLVPWTSAGINDAQLSPDGKTVVYHKGRAPDWYAADARGERRLGPGYRVLGLTNERIVLEQGRRVTSHRFDGSDPHPVVCLDNATSATAVSRSGRVAARVGDKLVSVAVDGSERKQPRVLGSASPWSHIVLDPVHERVVFERSAQFPREIVAVAIDGSQREPVLVARPEAELYRVNVTPNGHAALTYATTHTAVPHPYRTDVFATNGSGPRAGAIAVPTPAPTSVDMFGRDSRQVLTPYE